MLTADQFNAMFGANLNFLKFQTRLQLPVKSMQTATTENGARKASIQWEKDSSRMELLAGCIYPTLEVNKIHC